MNDIVHNAMIVHSNDSRAMVSADRLGIHEYAIGNYKKEVNVKTQSEGKR